MAPISHFLHSGGGEKYRAEQLQCKVRVENATVGRGNGNQMHDTGESFTADACCGRSKYVRVLILTRRMGKREELSSAKAEKLKRGGGYRGGIKSHPCVMSTARDTWRQRRQGTRDKEPQPPTLAVKALGEFVPFVTPFRKLES